MSLFSRQTAEKQLFVSNALVAPSLLWFWKSRLSINANELHAKPCKKIRESIGERWETADSRSLFFLDSFPELFQYMDCGISVWICITPDVVGACDIDHMQKCALSENLLKLWMTFIYCSLERSYRERQLWIMKKETDFGYGRLWKESFGHGWLQDWFRPLMAWFANLYSSFVLGCFLSIFVGVFRLSEAAKES